MTTLRKYLSILLVISVLMSLVAVSFVGTASAMTLYADEENTYVLDLNNGKGITGHQSFTSGSFTLGYVDDPEPGSAGDLAYRLSASGYNGIQIGASSEASEVDTDALWVTPGTYVSLTFDYKIGAGSKIWVDDPDGHFGMRIAVGTGLTSGKRTANLGLNFPLEGLSVSDLTEDADDRVFTTTADDPETEEDETVKETYKRKLVSKDTAWNTVTYTFIAPVVEDTYLNADGKYMIILQTNTNTYGVNGIDLMHVYLDNIAVTVGGDAITEIYDFVGGTGTEDAYAIATNNTATTTNSAYTSFKDDNNKGYNLKVDTDADNRMLLVASHSASAGADAFSGCNRIQVYDPDSTNIMFQKGATKDYVISVKYRVEGYEVNSKSYFGIGFGKSTDFNVAPSGVCYIERTEHDSQYTTADGEWEYITFALTAADIDTKLTALSTTAAPLMLYASIHTNTVGYGTGIKFRLDSVSVTTIDTSKTDKELLVIEDEDGKVLSTQLVKNGAAVYSDEKDEYGYTYKLVDSTGEAAGKVNGTTLITTKSRVTYLSMDTDAYTSVSSVTATAGVKDGDRTVMQSVSTGTYGRGSFNTLSVRAGRRYYLCFDAKADTSVNIVTAIGSHAAESGSNRYFYTGYDGNAGGDQNSGVSVKYVDGVKSSVTKANKQVFAADTTWKTYGLIFDVPATAYSSGFVNLSQLYLLIGSSAGTVYFDDLYLVEIGVAADAEVTDVPVTAVDAKHSLRAESDTVADYVSAGLRFRATIANTATEGAADIGFVVAPASLVSATENWYAKDGTGSAYAKSVSCKNTVYASDDTNTSYQLILTGLTKKDAEQHMLDTYFAVVMYVKAADGTYTYYDVSVKNYTEVKANYMVADKNYWTEY